MMESSTTNTTMNSSPCCVDTGGYVDQVVSPPASSKQKRMYRSHSFHQQQRSPSLSSGKATIRAPPRTPSGSRPRFLQIGAAFLHSHGHHNHNSSSSSIGSPIKLYNKEKVGSDSSPNPSSPRKIRVKIRKCGPILSALHQHPSTSSKKQAKPEDEEEESEDREEDQPQEASSEEEVSVVELVDDEDEDCDDDDEDDEEDADEEDEDVDEEEKKQDSSDYDDGDDDASRGILRTSASVVRFNDEPIVITDAPVIPVDPTDYFYTYADIVRFKRQNLETAILYGIHTQNGLGWDDDNGDSIRGIENELRIRNRAHHRLSNSNDDDDNCDVENNNNNNDKNDDDTSVVPPPSPSTITSRQIHGIKQQHKQFFAKTSLSGNGNNKKPSSIRVQHMRVVLEEQKERIEITGHCDPEVLSNVSSRSSKESRMIAIEKAKNDALAAEMYDGNNGNDNNVVTGVSVDDGAILLSSPMFKTPRTTPSSPNSVAASAHMQRLRERIPSPPLLSASSSKALANGSNNDVDDDDNDDVLATPKTKSPTNRKLRRVVLVSPSLGESPHGSSSPSKTPTTPKTARKFWRSAGRQLRHI